MEEWLKQLDIKVKNYEEAFANGYLLGQVLAAYNRILDFSEFQNAPDHAYLNVTKLQFALGKLGVTLDPYKLLNKTPYYVVRLLRKLQFKLEQAKAAPPLLLSKSEVMDKRTERFYAQRLKQAHKASLEQAKQVGHVKQLQAEFRQEHIDAIKANRVFMQQWEEEGRKNWKKNQQSNARRKQQEVELKTKLAWDFKKAHLTKLKRDASEVQDDIDQFEKNMIRLGIDHPEEGTFKKKKINLQAEAAFTMARIKENKAVNDVAAKERTLRIQKLQQEEERTKKLESHKRGSLKLTRGLRKIAKHATGPGFTKIRKKFRQVKGMEQSLMTAEDYAMRGFMEWGPIEANRQQAIRAEEQQRQVGLPQYKLEINQRLIERTKESRRKHFDECQPLIELMLDIAEEITSRNLKKVPESLWNEWMEEFKDGFRPGGREEDFLHEAIEEEPIDGQEPEEPSTARLASSESIQLYLDAQGTWSLGPVPNDDYLGDAVELILDKGHPVERVLELPAGPHYLPLKVCLMGPPFAGKKTQAKKLTELYGIKAYDMQQIVEDAKKVVQRKSEPDDPRKRKQQEEESALFTEASLAHTSELPDDRAALFRAKIRGHLGDQQPVEEEVKKPSKKEEVKCQGLSLLGYPWTLADAKALEKELTGFEHPEDLPEPLAAIKKREALLLAKPTQKPPSATEEYRSFFDLVIWMDIDLETVLKRALDRKVDPQGNIYNMNYNPPPDNILAKCKPVEKPTKEEVEAMFEEYVCSKEKLLAWFDQFKKQHWNWDVLHSCNGDVPVAEMTEFVLGKAKALMEIKQDPPPTPEPNNQVEFRGITVELSEEKANELAEEWETLKEQYTHNLAQALAAIDSHYRKFLTSLGCQTDNFVEYLMKEDRKVPVLKDTLQSINAFLTSKTVFLKEELEALRDQLDEALNILWDFIDQRKEDAIQFRLQLLEGNALDFEIKGLVLLAKKLLALELNKYFAVFNLLGNFREASMGEAQVPSKHPDLVIDWDLPLNQEGGCPALEHLVEQAQKASRSEEWLSQSTDVFQFRVRMIHSWAFKSLGFYHEKNQGLFDSMDSWIAEAVTYENKAINEFAEAVNGAIQTRKPLEEYEIPGLEGLRNVIDT